MILPDEATLKLFRQGPCLYCNRYGRTDAHHTFKTRGADGGTRIDVEEQIAPLCRPCHDRAQNDKLMNTTIMAALARRTSEKYGVRVDTDDIAEWLDRILAAPKEGPMPTCFWREHASDTSRVHRDGRDVHQDRNRQRQRQEADNAVRAAEARGKLLGEPVF